jgi:uncharacterized membrane protein
MEYGGVSIMLFWIALAGLILWFILKDKKEKDEPLEIARERLARGEITVKQFETIKRQL